MEIPGIGRVITIWYEVFCKLRLYFGVLAIRKKVFLESSHLIDTHLDVVVKVIDICSSVSF